MSVLETSVLPRHFHFAAAKGTCRGNCRGKTRADISGTFAAAKIAAGPRSIVSLFLSFAGPFCRGKHTTFCRCNLRGGLVAAIFERMRMSVAATSCVCVCAVRITIQYLVAVSQGVGVAFPPAFCTGLRSLVTQTACDSV